MLATDTLVRTHRQLAYYRIQTCQLEIFYNHLSAGYTIAEETNNFTELAIYCRLMGVYGIMADNHELATIFLERSHELLERNFKGTAKYTGNIAWVQNYFGDIFRAEQNYRMACEKYVIALDLCQKDEAIGAATMHDNYGQTLFAWGKYGEALHQFPYPHTGAALAESASLQACRSIL